MHYISSCPLVYRHDNMMMMILSYKKVLSGNKISNVNICEYNINIFSCHQKKVEVQKCFLKVFTFLFNEMNNSEILQNDLCE